MITAFAKTKTKIRAGLRRKRRESLGGAASSIGCSTFFLTAHAFEHL